MLYNINTNEVKCRGSPNFTAKKKNSMEYSIGDILELDHDSEVTARECVMMYQTVFQVNIPVDNGWICEALQTDRTITLKEFTVLVRYLIGISKPVAPACKIIQLDKKKFPKRRLHSRLLPVLEIQMLPHMKGRTMSGREHCKVVQFVPKKRKTGRRKKQPM